MTKLSKANRTILDWRLELTYECPVTRELVMIVLNPYDIASSASDCEICGSHGSISIDMPVKCLACGGSHDDIEMKSW